MVNGGCAYQRTGFVDCLGRLSFIITEIGRVFRNFETTISRGKLILRMDYDDCALEEWWHYVYIRQLWNV